MKTTGSYPPNPSAFSSLRSRIANVTKTTWPRSSESVKIRFHAEDVCSGQGIDSNIFVTPFGLIANSQIIELDIEKLKRQIRGRQRDLYVEPKLINLRCPDAGDRREERASKDGRDQNPDGVSDSVANDELSDEPDP